MPVPSVRRTQTMRVYPRPVAQSAVLDVCAMRSRVTAFRRITQRRGGRMTAPGSPEPPRFTAARFWPKVRRTRTCWVWTGATRGGYGSFEVGGRKRPCNYILAHRFAFQLANGEIPQGLELDHLCRNQLCVRPSHLEVVTHRENMLRGRGFAAQNAKKTKCPQGHEYSPRDGGGRECRECKAISQAKWAAKGRKSHD